MSKSADYAGISGTIGAVVMGLAGCESCVDHAYRPGQFPVTAFNLLSGGIVGALLGGVVGAIIGHVRDVEMRDEARRERLSAEKAATTAARAAALEWLHTTAVEIDRALNALPVILAEVEMALDRAEVELRDRLYAPFWEAIETAADGFQSLNNKLSFIQAKCAEYRDAAAKIGRDAKPLKVGVSALPDPADTRRRLLGLYRQAQKDRYYAVVYEQRRTNAILTAGFRSLGQAIEVLSDLAIATVDELSRLLECRLVSVEASLAAVVSSAEDHSATLRLQIQQSPNASEAVIARLRREAAGRSEDGQSALRMLDNLRMRRKRTLG